MQAYGQQQAGKAQSKMYQYQASLAQQQAAITKKYAEEQKKSIEAASEANITATQNQAADESKTLFRQITQLTGTQKATIGALGIGGVTAADIATDTFDKAKMDELAIRYNANVKSWQIGQQAKRDIWTIGEESKYKAWSLESEASQYSAAAKNARKAANINSATTLLSTATSMAMIGMVGSKPKPKPQVTP
jgi:small-conductance mechanosensitive channel